MRKKLIIILGAVLILLIALLVILYNLGVVPHKMYDSEHFGIEEYKSEFDADGDGIDDQTDILMGVRAYIAKEPIYKSKYYGKTGYPDDGFGVCTDVVAFGLLSAGYDLMELVDLDIKENPDDYKNVGDKKIDFRRVRNLLPYFENTAIKLTTDIKQIEEWQGGDIVIFTGHIGIVSDKRNYKGIPFVIHHANPAQIRYEEDILTKYEIIGHYRVS